MPWQFFQKSVDVPLVLTEIHELKNYRTLARDFDGLIGQYFDGYLFTG